VSAQLVKEYDELCCLARTQDASAPTVPQVPRVPESSVPPNLTPSQRGQVQK
jgi:hypothetical protein